MSTVNPNVSYTKKDEQVSFRCSDVGPKDCNWQVRGKSEEEIMPKD